jgi:hypothetical protein
VFCWWQASDWQRWQFAVGAFMLRSNKSKKKANDEEVAWLRSVIAKAQAEDLSLRAQLESKDAEVRRAIRSSWVGDCSTARASFAIRV